MKLVKFLPVVGLFAASQAHAVIDVTGVVTEINATLGPVGLIGSAVLLVIVAIMAYKWVRRAF